MKKLIIALNLILIAQTYMFSQEVNDNFDFYLSPDKVKVYNSESITSKPGKGFFLVDEFEDNFSLKLTNTLYKVNLFFDVEKGELLVKSIKKVLKKVTFTEKRSRTTWKKKDENKKPVYSIELVGNKLKFKIYRKQMDPESYELINQLGKTAIKEINL